MNYETETTYAIPRVFAAITTVAAAMAKRGIGKNRTADTGARGTYQFRGIDDFFNALAPELAAAKLCILPRCTERTVVERQSSKGNALFYITVTMEFDFVSAEDASKHTVGPFYGEAMDSGDKATNKAMSAAYKYCVMQSFAIPIEGQAIDSESETHEVISRSPKQEQALDELRDAALNGTFALEVAWKAAGKENRLALASELQSLKDAAAKADGDTEGERANAA